MYDDYADLEAIEAARERRDTLRFRILILVVWLVFVPGMALLFDGYVHAALIIGGAVLFSIMMAVARWQHRKAHRWDKAPRD